MREMKRWIPLLAGPLAIVLLAPTMPRDEKETLKVATHRLAELGNYSWSVAVNRADESVELSERALFGPAEGFQEKEGLVRIRTKDATPLEVVLKGGKMAVRLEDGWVSERELEVEGRRRSRAPVAFIRSLKSVPRPAAEAQELLKHAKELKSTSAGYFFSPLGPEAAKELLHRSLKTIGRAPKISEAGGQLSFWVQDGILVKYEVQLRGELTFDPSGAPAFKANHTRVIELSALGITKVEVPEEAMKKLE
jgi:hypothetical protein